MGGACQDAADGDGGLRTRASANKRLVTPSGPVPNDDHVKLGLLLGQPPSHPLLGEEAGLRGTWASPQAPATDMSRALACLLGHSYCLFLVILWNSLS